MLLHFTYCDAPNFNLTDARNENLTVEFDYDVSDLTPLTSIGAKPFQVELLNGYMWELRKLHRFRQSFTTNPDVLLNGTRLRLVTYDPATNTINIAAPAFVSYKDLLIYWYQARNRWITTDELTDEQVIITSPDLTFEKSGNVRFMNKVTVEYETAAPR